MSLAAIRLLVRGFVDPSRGFDYSHGTDHRLCWMSLAAVELTILDMRTVQQKRCVYTGLITQHDFLALI